MVSSNKNIRSIAPEARSCYFEDEMDLTFYEKYTFINCQLECVISKVENALGCIPWHLPKVTCSLFYQYIQAKYISKENNTRTCDPWTAQKFEEQMTVVQNSGTKLCPHCLPDCNHIAYSSSTSSAEFRYICKRLDLHFPGDATRVT